MQLKKILLFSFLLLAPFLNIQAQLPICIGMDLDITNGYRRDDLSCLIHVFDPPDTFQFADDLHIKDISIYQVGLKGKWLFNNWQFHLEGDCGWANSGNYEEAGTATISRAHVHHGQVKDLIIGFGYLFPICWNLRIGPVAGWSYNSQKIKIHHAETGDLPDPILNHLRYRNRWQGPWVGINTKFHICPCNLGISGGYEYHWADWHATWRLHGPDVPGVAFSDKRHSNDAHGQVVYLDARWNFWYCWNVGFGLKYQTFRAVNGRERPFAGSFAAVGLSSTEVDKVKHATWRSWAATLDVGYTF